MRALLDVNVLIALLDASHVHHCLASRWLGEHLDAGWASCPMTQNGCIRIMSAPAYPGDHLASEVASRLAGACRHPAHAFWPEDISVLDEGRVRWMALAGHRQITDAYLLALAVRNGGRLVTLDRRISLDTVIGARTEHFLVLGED